MRRTMKRYRKFFANKERVAKLARLGHRYDAPLALHTDIMAVLAGLAGGSAQDVIIAVLEGGLIDEANAPLENIRKFGSIEAFWQMVQGITALCTMKKRRSSIWRRMCCSQRWRKR